MMMTALAQWQKTYFTCITCKVLVLPDSRIREPLVIKYWSPDCNTWRSNNMASTSVKAVSWSELVAIRKGRTPRYIAMRRCADTLGVNA